MRDVPYDTVHRSTKEILALIVHGHHNEQFRSARRVIVHLTQRESRILEIIRVTSRSRVPHVRKLAFGPHRRHIEQFRRHRRVQHEISMEQLDLLERLVPSRNPLWDASISDIGLGLIIHGGYFGVATWHRHGPVGIFALEKRKLAIRVVFICGAERRLGS